MDSPLQLKTPYQLCDKMKYRSKFYLGFIGFESE